MYVQYSDGRRNGVFGKWGPGFVLPAALLIGLSIGAEGDVTSYLTARYFGLRHYGRVYGCFYAVSAIGLGTSPLAIGEVAAVSSYRDATWVVQAC